MILYSYQEVIPLDKQLKGYVFRTYQNPKNPRKYYLHDISKEITECSSRKTKK